MPFAPPVRDKEVLAQIGPLLAAMAVGKGLTDTLVDAELVQVPSLIVKVYMPDMDGVARAETTGLWVVFA